MKGWSRVDLYKTSRSQKRTANIGKLQQKSQNRVKVGLTCTRQVSHKAMTKACNKCCKVGLSRVDLHEASKVTETEDELLCLKKWIAGKG